MPIGSICALFSETFVRQKKFGSGSIFCLFASVACILIGKDGEYEKTEKRMRKFQTQCAMAFRVFILTDDKTGGKIP